MMHQPQLLIPQKIRLFFACMFLIYVHVSGRTVPSNVASPTPISKIKPLLLPDPVAPTANFIVNKTTGFTTDTFRFTDLSNNEPTHWLWTFIPNDVTYINGTNASSQNPVLLLNRITNYDVTLKAINQQGNNVMTKFGYINVITDPSLPSCSFCPNPLVSPPLPVGLDIGITRVVLADLDTTTALSKPIYHGLFSVKSATLYRGVTYTLSTSRTTANDPMSTRAWIDFNLNTSFGDEAIETIISENNQNKIITTGTFTVPANAPIGNTRLRIGVTYGNTSITDMVTSLGCFEEYGINIAVDTVKPVITLIDSGLVKVLVDKPYHERGVTAIDNLEGNISTRYQVLGIVNTSIPGYYTLKYFVTDLYGNCSDTLTRIVLVEADQTIPDLTIIGGDSIAIEVFSSYIEHGATAFSNKGLDISGQIISTGNVDTALLGTYFITYSVTDQFGLNTIKKRKVVVRDSTKPIITMLGEDPLIVDVHSTFNDPGVQTSDNYYPGVIAIGTGLPSMNILGDYLVTYTATDGAGNVATATRLVKVVDRIAPEIVLMGNNPFELCRYKPYADPGVKIKDNYYADSILQQLVTIDLTGLNVSKPGYYFISFNVTDPSGNKALMIQRLVQVLETGQGSCLNGGISELNSNSSISIFPNPNKGLFTIVNKINTKIIAIQVMDSRGRMVYNKEPQLTEVEIDLGLINKGLYMVVIKDEQGNDFSGKVMVE